MRFKNREERKQHPQASMIPENIFVNSGSFLENAEDYFYYSELEFPDALISLLQTIQTQPNELLIYLKKNQQDLKKINKKVCLVIALSYPQLDADSIAQIKDLLNLSDKVFFMLCAEAGNDKCMEVMSKTLGKRWFQQVVRENDSEIFSLAAANGCLNVLKYLAAHVRCEDLRNSIKANGYDIFCKAVAHAQTDILHYLQGYLNDSDELIRDIILKHACDGIILAASEGNLKFFRYLGEKVSDRLTDIILERNFEPFLLAAQCGYVAVLEYLVKQMPYWVECMVSEKNYYAFHSAASNGHLPVLEYLESIMPNKLQKMIAAEKYYAFRAAASQGHLAVLNYLAMKAPHKLQDMIASENYETFNLAADGEHLSVLDYLISQAPDKLQSMLGFCQYVVFRSAARDGHLSVLKYLAKKAPDKLEVMIKADNYSAIHWAAVNHHEDVLNFLFDQPIAFEYAESCEGTLTNYITTYINKRLEDLRRVITDYGDQSVPLTAAEAKQWFYIAKGVIRRNISVEDLHLILGLPAVKELAHQSVDSGVNNQLLRLAGRGGNQDAFGYLLTIPAVRREAEINNFYFLEYEGGIDLQSIAQNNESSMLALSQEEENHLKTLKDHYWKEGHRSSFQIIEELRVLLIKRYKENPAKVMLTHSQERTKKLALPLTWKEFNALGLSKREKQFALKAYYRDKNHTAWRFLEKPNPWMDSHALYSYWNASGPYSAFEDYSDFIAVLFLAAKDKNSPEIDGYSVESRLTQFIDELALIERAHNWDKQNPKHEEYDDLEGDKPSCPPGIKRRLFQSIQGHPLMKQLTLNILQQELREFVWHHFQNVITKKNYKPLRIIWQKYIDMEPLTKKEETILAEINIPKLAQTTWVEALQVKYGKQISRYDIFLLQTFDLSDRDSHLIRFSYLGLDQLLKDLSFQKEKEKCDDCFDSNGRSSPVVRDAPVRFFYRENRTRSRPLGIYYPCMPF